MIDYFALALTLAGIGIFGYAAEYESRDGGRNHRVLWCSLSLVISILTAGWGVLPWLFGQAGLFVGIAVVRVWLEDRQRK